MAGLLIGNDYWCVFLRRHSGRSTYRRRYFKAILVRKILDEKQMVIYRWAKRFVMCGNWRFAAHGLSKVLEPKELAWIETRCEISNVPHHCDFAIGILQLCRESLVTNKMANFAAGTWAYGILLLAAVFMRSLWCRQIPLFG